MSRETRGTRIRPRLFIAGDEDHSRQALANVRDICRGRASVTRWLEIVDVLRDPDRAMSAGVVLAPCLLVEHDGRVAIICGEMGDRDALLSVLTPPHKHPVRANGESSSKSSPDTAVRDNLTESLVAGQVDAVVSGGRVHLLRSRDREEAGRGTLDELERIVQKRTLELVMSNEVLREEIAERKRAEEELRLSESRFRNLFENSPFASLKLDLSAVRRIIVPYLESRSPDSKVNNGAAPGPDGEWLSSIRLIAANRAALDLFEAESCERLSDSFASLFLEETMVAFVDSLERLYRGENLVEVETAAVTFGGKRKDLRVSMHAGPGCEKDWFRVMAYFIDRTARKKSERRLRRSEALLSEAQHIARLGSWEWSVIDNNLYWSETLYDIFGVPLGREMTYERFLDCVHADDREKVDRAVREAFDKKENYSIEHRIVLPGGGQRVIHERAEVRFDERGLPVRMIGTAQDITDLKQAEQSLIAEREKLRQMLGYQRLQAETATCLNVRTSFSEAVDEVLAGVCNSLEIGSACFFRIEGQTVEKIELYRQYTRYSDTPVCGCFEDPDYSAEVLACVKKDLPYRLSTRDIRRQTGLERLFDDKNWAILSCPLSVGGRVKGFICFGRRDGRQWKQTEEDVLQTISEMIAGAWERDQQFQARLEAEKKKTGAVRMAEQATRLASIGVLAGGITHEINQPLNAMSLATDSLIADVESLGSPDPEELLGHLGTISGQIRRIGEIITHMRTFWVSPEGVRNQPFDLNEPLERALNLIRSRLQDHLVSLDFQQCADPLPVCGNPIHIEQIVLNLVVNAIQALDDTDKTDKLISVRSFNRKGFAVLTVEDNGPGFRMEDRNRLFDPFYSTRKPGEGTGLGLAIVKKFVEEFGGTIEARLGENGGASFHLEFPLCEDDL